MIQNMRLDIVSQFILNQKIVFALIVQLAAGPEENLGPANTSIEWNITAFLGIFVSFSALRSLMQCLGIGRPISRF